jgi:citrate lyase subunit gamma (acyl carrier protein)
LNTLHDLNIKNAKVNITDREALECTIKERVEAAYYRSIDQTINFPWRIPSKRLRGTIQHKSR